MVKQHIPPLLDIQSEAFARQYEHGVWWAMHGERKENGLLPDRYLVENLKTYEEKGYFERNEGLEHIGFFIGMIHGAVLSPQTGQLRPDVTTLVHITHPQFKRGYRVGREAYFHEGERPGANRQNERDVVEWLRDLVLGNPYQESDHAATWYYTIGDLLGGFSGQLFSETEAERLHWQRTVQAFQHATQQSQPAQEQRSASERSAILQEA